VLCPCCAATTTVEQPRRTALGHRTFRCRACCRTFNERTGTSFNDLLMARSTDDALLALGEWDRQ